MAEIDKALGTNNRESQRRRALSKMDDSISERTTLISTTSSPVNTSNMNKLYDRNYARFNESPIIWTYLKQQWQDHTAGNVTKKTSPKEKNENFDNSGRKTDTATTTPIPRARAEEIQSS